MNSEAARNAKKIQRALKTGKMGRKKILCDSANENCQGEIYLDLWYDIFSADPKGILAQCEYHRDREGIPEGFFYCDGCNRTMITNITWELYYAVHEDNQLCLPCYAEEILADESNWIPLTDTAIDSLTFEQVRHAPHCIGVEMPVPKQIRFVNNVEFDSMTGARVSGGGVEELKQTLRQLQTEGQTRAILILDAGWQFAVSIGVYAPIIKPEDRAYMATAELETLPR